MHWGQILQLEHGGARRHMAGFIEKQKFYMNREFKLCKIRIRVDVITGGNESKWEWTGLISDWNLSKFKCQYNADFQAAEKFKVAAGYSWNEILYRTVGVYTMELTRTRVTDSGLGGEVWREGGGFV